MLVTFSSLAHVLPVHGRQPVAESRVFGISHPTMILKVDTFRGILQRACGDFRGLLTFPKHVRAASGAEIGIRSFGESIFGQSADVLEFSFWPIGGHECKHPSPMPTAVALTHPRSLWERFRSYLGLEL